MTGPELYIRWINAHLGFNPRGAKNSDAISEYVLGDLKNASPKAIGALLQSGHLNSKKNANVSVGAAGLTVRNIDLVLSEKDSLVQLSVENKTIMTAHGKARKNRYGDIIAYCNHMHNHRGLCVAGATVVINASEFYENPDAFARGLVRPRFKMEKVVLDTIGVFAKIPLRDTPSDPTELPEAVAVIVVNYDGVNDATLVDDIPDRKNPSHYHNFISRLAAIYEDRFCQ